MDYRIAELIAERGWNAHSMVQFLRAFIRQEELDEKLYAFLQEIAEVEDAT